MSPEFAQLLANNYNALTTDSERLRFLQGHQDYFVLLLDNDLTIPSLVSDNYRLDIKLKPFKHFLGNTQGVFNLLELIGINTDGA